VTVTATAIPNGILKLASYRRPEPVAYKIVVMQQSEHDDMASDNNSSKTAATQRKPGPRIPSPQLPQIQPPLLNDGQEQVRDSHC